MNEPKPTMEPGAVNAVERLAGESKPSPFWPEHRSRYRFAAQYVNGRTVLDVACGDGWGGPILIDAGAGSLLGIDASEDAIRAAQRQLLPGYRVELADATRLPIPDRSFDVIVSFETIEHLDRPERFLDEARRVLRDDGVLLLSTPNADHTKPVDGVPRNPFHIREYTAPELARMLSDRFSSISVLGQRVHPRFRPCPYWERAELCADSLRGRLRSLRWKVLVRLPLRYRDAIARTLLGHGLFPGEDDFVFDPSDIDGGHVLMAVCRP